MKGILYLVGTPIGNMGDITLRALETLKSVDVIAAEDTRNTLKLLNRYDIKVPLTSYYEHKKREKGEYILKQLLEGKNVALVTDAGMPAVSDPGASLAELCIENDVEFTVIPGPTAAVTGLVMSGLPCERFCFEGFLTVKKTGRMERLEALKKEERTLIFYEAPHKLVRTLTDMYAVFGDRRIAICRELTKKFEQTLRLKISEALKYYENNEPRGEFVLVVEGYQETEEEKEKILPLEEQVDECIQAGMDKKEAIANVAKTNGIPKREVYNLYLKYKN